MTLFLAQNIHFSLMMVDSIRVGTPVLKTVSSGAVLIGVTLKGPLQDQKVGVWSATTAARTVLYEPHLKYKILLFKNRRDKI
jgi:hypothetical protein